MTLSYLEDIIFLQNAVKKANEILSNPEFYKRIISHTPFTNTSLNNSQIADLIQNSTQTVTIKTYRDRNFLGLKRRCTNAKTGNSSMIKVNLRCFSQVLKSGVNTLIHETVHAVDFADHNLDFTHFNNRNDGEEDNTAPWAIGKIAESMV